MNKKIGIYGGTFDPVHKGHESAALQFFRLYNPDELMIIPTSVPPHKQSGDVSAQYRYEMCRLAFGKINSEFNVNIRVSDIEIASGEVSYTFNTLKKLRNIYGNDCEFLFLIGADMFLCLDKWYKYEELFDLCSFVVTKRTPYDATAESEERMKSLKEEFARDFGAKIDIADIKFLDISSTLVRDMISKGKDVSEFLSPEVIKFIRDNNLYR